MISQSPDEETHIDLSLPHRAGIPKLTYAWLHGKLRVPVALRPKGVYAAAVRWRMAEVTMQRRRNHALLTISGGLSWEYAVSCHNVTGRCGE